MQTEHRGILHLGELAKILQAAVSGSGFMHRIHEPDFLSCRTHTYAEIYRYFGIYELLKKTNTVRPKCYGGSKIWD